MAAFRTGSLHNLTLTACAAAVAPNADDDADR
jgi:hypothetical protein